MFLDWKSLTCTFTATGRMHWCTTVERYGMPGRPRELYVGCVVTIGRRNFGAVVHSHLGGKLRLDNGDSFTTYTVSVQALSEERAIDGGIESVQRLALVTEGVRIRSVWKRIGHGSTSVKVPYPLRMRGPLFVRFSTNYWQARLFPR